MNLPNWLYSYWCWYRSRRRRVWALNRAHLAHIRTASDSESAPSFRGRNPKNYKSEIAALAAAVRARSPDEIVTALLPIYWALNVELREHPGFAHTFLFREEIGWLLYFTDPRLGYPGNLMGPLRYQSH